VQLILLPFRQK